MNLAQLLCDLGQVTSLGLSFFTYKMAGGGVRQGVLDICQRPFNPDTMCTSPLSQEAVLVSQRWKFQLSSVLKWEEQVPERLSLSILYTMTIKTFLKNSFIHGPPAQTLMTPYYLYEKATSPFPGIWTPKTWPHVTYPVSSFVISSNAEV